MESLNNSLLPNFLIVGTAKAATTTIHEYLSQHPEIFMSEWKEPCFFSFANKKEIKYKTGKRFNYVSNIEEYKKLFTNGKGYKIRGESSTPYLYFHKETIQNIKKYIPDYKNIKILIILRNPINRAYSQYMMKVRGMAEDLSFENAILHEKKRMEQNLHFDFYYTDRGLYYEQVKNYLREFKNVKVLIYEEFKSNTSEALMEILSFLDVDPRFNFTKIAHRNVSGKPKIPLLNTFIYKQNPYKNFFRLLFPSKIRNKLFHVIRDNNVKKIPIDSKSKFILEDFYYNDVKKLETLLNKDLSIWIKKQKNGTNK